MNMPKLLIVGHGQHGKDTVCDILFASGFTYKSSSRICSELFIFDQLKSKYGYATEVECYEDRHNHRDEWYDMIEAYNKPDATRLGREIFSRFDIYCGLRSDREFFAMREQKVFDFSVWVDRSKILPLEPESSMKLKREWMDYEIDNNGTLLDLPRRIFKAIQTISIDWLVRQGAL
jgi:hypothetical protein